MDDNMKPDYKFSDFVSETLNILTGKSSPRKTIDENLADDFGVTTPQGHLERAITEKNPSVKNIYRAGFENAYSLFYGLAEVFCAFSDWSANKNPNNYSVLNHRLKSLRDSTNFVKRSTLKYQKQQQWQTYT